MSDMNPAEKAAGEALERMFMCLRSDKSFVLEAGAGAGKTHSLVQALRFLISRQQFNFPQRHQRIACITFTNVAKEEIDSRTDGSPLVFCDTIHAFCWSLIGKFQGQIRDILPSLADWSERVQEAGGIGGRPLEYTLGYRAIHPERISLHHDDVLRIATRLTASSHKFRELVTSRYPVILIDEYQDTDAEWISCIKQYFIGQTPSPVFGFFGDHWQKIYGSGCGNIEHNALTVIGKKANFRSAPAIVDSLNRMRPSLPQMARDPSQEGIVHVFHTNSWIGQRQRGNHWGGDLPNQVAHEALEAVKRYLSQDGWDLDGTSTKILMLTHRVLANEQGYSSLPTIFRYNDSFAKKEDPHLAFFVDVIEPACGAFLDRRYGAMFQALGTSMPPLRTPADKRLCTDSMKALIALRDDGTVGQVIAHLRKTRRPRVPDAIEDRERALERFPTHSAVEMPPSLVEVGKLHAVPYREVVALARYHSGYSPFQTNHGVKGAQFENVIVVVGRGWNVYNFNEMLELARDINHIPAGRKEAYERNRNLFYVSCSRAKRRLALLFTQELSPLAMQTVEEWFEPSAVKSLVF